MGIRSMNKFRELSFQREFTEGDYELLKKGIKAERWRVFWEDHQLLFVRTWTGTCIFKMTFEIMGLSRVTRNVFVNINPEKYRPLDENEAKVELNEIIDFILKKESLYE